jgi:hypothetical protein
MYLVNDCPKGFQTMTSLSVSKCMGTVNGAARIEEWVAA